MTNIDNQGVSIRVNIIIIIATISSDIAFIVLGFITCKLSKSVPNLEKKLRNFQINKNKESFNSKTLQFEHNTSIYILKY